MKDIKARLRELSQEVETDIPNELHPAPADLRRIRRKRRIAVTGAFAIVALVAASTVILASPWISTQQSPPASSTPSPHLEEEPCQRPSQDLGNGSGEIERDAEIYVAVLKTQRQRKGFFVLDRAVVNPRAEPFTYQPFPASLQARIAQLALPAQVRFCNEPEHERLTTLGSITGEGQQTMVWMSVGGSGGCTYILEHNSGQWRVIDRKACFNF